MFQISRWLSLYWFLLLPLVSFLAAGICYRGLRQNLINERGKTAALLWSLLAILSSQIYLWLLIISSAYETALWPLSAASFMVLLITFSSYQASRYSYFDSPDLKHTEDNPFAVDEEPINDNWKQRIVLTLKRSLLFLLAITISVYVLLQQNLRWPGFWLVTIVILSPLFITGRKGKSLWFLPTTFTLIVLAFSWHVFQLREGLPPGNWITPTTSVSCSSAIRLDLDHEFAWCADEKTGRVYKFTPGNGFVYQRDVVEYGAQAFIGNNNRAWVMQNPAKGLVRVDKDKQTQVKINLAQQGTVDRQGRLWIIDVTGVLWVNEHEGEWKRLKESDGLLGNTANVVKTSPDGSVWVGSVGGVSVLASGSSDWHHILDQDVLPGFVHDFAFTPDGDVWYLWKTFITYQNRARWGVSNDMEGRWEHFDISAATGLDAPTTQNPIAIDGFGRIWFTAPSYFHHANFLGILVPSNGVINTYHLGPFDILAGGTPVPGFHGVLNDGEGGIFLYNPIFTPLRHWRPGQKPYEFDCPQPCAIASRGPEASGGITVALRNPNPGLNSGKLIN